MKTEVKITDFFPEQFAVDEHEGLDEKLPHATPISSEVSDVKGKDIHTSNRQSLFIFNCTRPSRPLHKP